MKILSIICLVFFFTACSQQNIITDWSDGECNKEKSCQEIEYGCGNIMCTSNPEKYKDLMSTCEIITNHPSQQDYNCECVNDKCVWRK